MQVTLDTDVLVGAGGRVLVGGRPTRLFRLSDVGAAVVATWLAGHPVSAAPAERRLGARLVAAGVLHPVPAPEPPAGRVTVVVPTNRSGAQLDQCLSALAQSGETVVVVDDGSPDPRGIQRTASAHRASVVRLDINRGPAGARNVGLAASETPFVAFVDSDVVVDPGWLDLLVPHFNDPVVGAVAPRVNPLAHHGGATARYEALRSALDMGPKPAVATPQGRVAYVPSAALVVRRERFIGFDDSLRVGEDVDFCWRTVAAGQRVVYDPRASVRHDHRVRAREFAARRWAYAQSIGELAVRHPDALPAARTTATGAALLVGAVAERPEIVGMALAVLLRRHGRAVRDRRLGLRLAVRDGIGHLRSAAWAARRPWLIPLLLCAPRSRRVRRALAAAWLVGVAERRLRPREVPLAMLDDAIAAAATWVGCARARTLRPVLPRGTRRRSRATNPS